MAFHDGLGERRVSRDNNGDVEQLRLRQELSSVPSFEFALRERATRLAQFRHPAFARVRSIERGSGGEPGLMVVSEYAQGWRLADVIGQAETKGIPIELGATLCLMRQLIPAIAILHEAARDVAHGAIAPERLVVTRSSRLVVTDYVLGSALEQLLYSRDRYWSELRIPLPRAAGLARLDQQADVVQIGAVALSLILGRRLREDDSSSTLSELLASAKARAADGTTEPLPDVLRLWLQRALHLDPRAAFPSAVEARLAFDRVIDESPCDVSPARLEALLSRVGGDPQPAAAVVDEASKLQTRAAVVDFKPVADARAFVSAAPERVPAPLTFGSAAVAVAAAPAPAPVLTPTPSITAPAPALAATPMPVSAPKPLLAPSPAPIAEEPVPVPTSAMFGVSVSDDQPTAPEPRGRSKSLTMAVGVVAVAVIGVVATVAWPRKPPAPVAPPVVASGTLAVTTDPSGAQVVIDGAAQGIAPVTLTLAPGSHTLVVRGEFGERSVPVTIGAGSQVAQYLDLPKAAPAVDVVAPVAAPAPVPADTATADAPLAGWLAVESRFNVQLFEAGKLLGSSQSDRIMVGAGRHDLELVNDELGYRSTRAVQVVAGKVASLSIDAPNGTIALNALPWAEVIIDGEKAGETPLGNVSLPIGEHDVVFRHPELGEQRFRVALTLKAPARLSADLRKK